MIDRISLFIRKLDHFVWITSALVIKLLPFTYMANNSLHY